MRKSCDFSQLFLNSMIIGIGNDIISINRVEKAIEREAFIKRVYTDNEINYCESRGKGKAASYAARFAAKEAVLKAFGTGLRYGELTDIEILNDDLGAPVIKLYGAFLELAKNKGVKTAHISLSHEREFATAFCVLEGQNEDSSER